MTNRIATVILLSGKAETIQHHVREIAHADMVTVIPSDEKSITHFKKTSGLLRQGAGQEAVCFACKELELQRYQVILKFYLLFAPARQRFLIDESGANQRVTLAGYLLKDLPIFLVEVLASAVVLVRSFIRLVVLHRATGRRKAS